MYDGKNEFILWYLTSGKSYLPKDMYTSQYVSWQFVRDIKKSEVQKWTKTYLSSVAVNSLK